MNERGESLVGDDRADHKGMSIAVDAAVWFGDGGGASQ